MKFTSFQKLICSFPVVLICVPALAYDAPSPAYDLQLRSFIDYAHFKASELNQVEDELEFRSLRATLNARPVSGVELKLSTEFSHSDVTIEDAFLKYNVSEAFSVTVGRHRPPVSLEEQTSALDLSFAERAAFTDAFNFARAIGVSASYHQNGFTLSSGLYSESRDVSFSPDTWSYAARATYGWENGEYSWLVGSSFWHTANDTAGDRIYSGQANAHEASPVIVAALSVEDEKYLGFEAAFKRKQFHIAAEYGRLKTQETGLVSGDSFKGGYAEVGYFLTKHERTLDIKAGKWGSYQSLEDVGLAVQLVARADFLSLNDENAVFGTQESYLFGVNLHFNRHIRFLLNAAFQNYETAEATSINARSVTTRLQLVW